MKEKREDIFSKGELIELYINKEMPTRDIAKLRQCSQSTVRRYLKKYDIKARTDKESRSTKKHLEKMKPIYEKYSNDYRIYHEKQCEYCDKTFSIDHKNKNNKFCSQKCLKASLVKTYEYQECEMCKSIIPDSNIARKIKYCKKCRSVFRSESQTKRVIRNCGFCEKELNIIPSKNTHDFVYCNTQCMGEHYKIRLLGEDSPTWKNGEGHGYAGNWAYYQKATKERDNYTCQRCGVKEEDSKGGLYAHHIANYHSFENKYEANQLSNTVTVCPRCHNFIHSSQNTEKILIKERKI